MLLGKVANALNMELYERNIGGEYNNTRLVKYSQGERDLFINRISILGGKGGEKKINDDDGRKFIFDSRYLIHWGCLVPHRFGGDLSGCNISYLVLGVLVLTAIYLLEHLTPPPYVLDTRSEERRV